MRFAIIAIIITVVLLVIAITIIFYVRNKQQRGRISTKKNVVTSIDTVGEYADLKRAGGGPAIQVNAARESASNLAERVRYRFMAMGVFAAAIFGSLGIRLWSMQILASDEYTKKAQENLYTTVSTTAPRGCIFDADGVALVKNRTSLTVLADAEVAQDRVVVQRLSALLGVPHNVVRERIRDSKLGAQAQRIVASDVKLRDIAFISEHSTAFPRITTKSLTVREYPYEALAAHVLGYSGTTSEEDLKIPPDGYIPQMGDVVGKEGIEKSYNRVLSGDHGQRVVLADADGTVREVVSETQPVQGNDIYLTLSAQVQQVADKELARLVAPNGIIGENKGTAASLVCIDCRDGGIIAMANYPTYAPGNFVGGIPTETWELFNSDESRQPMYNRAVAGSYAAASTFKAFTGLAGFAYGFADETREWDCEGTWTGFGREYPQKCHKRSGHGLINFREGIEVSCDTVFYEIAKSFYDARADVGETALQDFVKKFGFGTKTGIDLGSEAAGLVPTPEWKQEKFRDAPEEAPWRPGDLSNMVIGQGYIEVTPLQLALGYVAVATGNHVKPHLLKEVKNSRGETVVKYEPQIWPLEGVSKEHLDIMRDALRGMVAESRVARENCALQGLSDVAGKTGTAEKPPEGDYGLFVCYTPTDEPKYLVACVVEQGGSGTDSAIPSAIEVLGAAVRYGNGELDDPLTPIPGSTGKSLSNEEFMKLHGFSGRTD